jgi:CBS domain-containing protein
MRPVQVEEADMLVREVMSSPAVTVTARTSVREALRLLDRHSITSLPVVDGRGAVVGVVSEADLVREAVIPDPRSHMLAPEATDVPPASHVEDVMTRHAVTVADSADLAMAVDLLTSTTVKSVPVVSDGRVVGVLSRRDVVRLLARDDERITAEVSELFRSDGVDWLVEVVDGVVEVSGPRDEPERRVAQVLAGTVPGVVAVRITSPRSEHAR